MTGTKKMTETIKKRKPYKRKFNTQNVIKLKKQGMTMTNIAKIEGTTIPAISRYLGQVAPQLKAIKQYNDTKADALSLSQLKLQTVSNILVDSWLENPETLKSLDTRLQKEVLVAVQGAKTYECNSERLERGQSTSNIAQLHADIAKIRAMGDKIIDVEDD